MSEYAGYSQKFKRLIWLHLGDTDDDQKEGTYDVSVSHGLCTTVKKIQIEEASSVFK